MPNLQSTNLLITCDIVSQHPLMPRGVRAAQALVKITPAGLVYIAARAAAVAPEGTRQNRLI